MNQLINQRVLVAHQILIQAALKVISLNQLCHQPERNLRKVVINTGNSHLTLEIPNGVPGTISLGKQQVGCLLQISLKS